MKSLSKLSLLLFTLVSVQFTYAQTPEWNSIYKTAWTGDFIDFDISKNSEVAAFSENGFLYHSADTGKTWTPVFNCLLEDKSSYLRTSKGLNGEDEYILSYNYDLEFSPDSLQGICYFRYDSLDVKTTFMVLTNDGGKTWKHSSYNFTGKSIRSLYWKTADSAFVTVYDNVVQKAFMYVTNDSGENWNITSGQITSSKCHFCFFSESEGYAFSLGTHYKTTDGGQTWQAYSDPNLYVDGIHKLANGNVLLIGNDDDKAINITTDDSRFIFTKMFTYTPVTPLTLTSYDVFSVSELENGDLYVSNDGDCFYSSDGENSWNEIGDWGSSRFVNDQIVLNVGNSLTTRISYNKGQTWETHVHEAGEGLESLHVRSREELYVRSGQNLLHTTDGGETWKTLHFNENLSNMQFVTNDTIYLSGQEVIYRSINAGQTWERFETEANGANLYFVTPDIGYLGAKRLTAGGSIIYKTLDAGETWTEADGTATWDWDFGDNKSNSRGAFKSTTEGLMDATNGVVHTTNGGDNWEFISGIEGVPFYINNTWILRDRGEHVIYTCDENINCTKTFTDIETYSVSTQNMGNINRIDDNTIILTYDSAEKRFIDSVIVSRDNGQTWTKEYNPHPDWNVKYYDNKTVFGLGSRVIYKGIIKVQTTGSFGLSIDQQNINCTVTNELQENFVATITIIKNGTETITVSTNTTIVNNQEFSVTIPTSITSSDNFVVVIEPNDDTYAKSTSQSFQITGTTTVQTTVEEFELSTDQKNINCTIANEANENFLGTIKIVKNDTETITVSENTTIVNNLEFSITIPSSITKDDSFVVIIEPNDTKYEQSTSESFQITDTGTSLNQIENKHTITVIGNRIICNCEDFEIYNTIGQIVHKNTELQSGTYIVKCGKISEKIVVKP